MLVAQAVQRALLLCCIARARCCSFLVANYNLTADHNFSSANELQARRGPDGTAVAWLVSGRIDGH
eukprot:1617598-Prymnesium_polylepis.1